MGRLLQNLKVSRKLVLIGLSFTLPIAILLYYAVESINKELDLTRKELAGTEYLRPLARLLKLIPDHQFLAHEMRAGARDRDGPLQAARAQVDEYFRILAAADRKSGAELQMTEDGLERRNRGRATAAVIQGQWDDLKRALATLAPEASDERHHRLTEAIRTLIAQVVDTSDLIVDPDVDSFYLVNATAIDLPQAQYRLAQAIADGNRMLERKALPLPERVRLATYAAMLKEVDLDRAASDIRTALIEDPNFHGASASLQANVPRALDAYLAEMGVFVELINQVVASEEVTADPSRFVAEGRRAREAGAALRAVTTDELDGLLRTRIAADERSRAWTLGLTGGALALSLGLVVLVARGITRPLARCSASLQALAAKDLTHEVEAGGEDELGRMSTAVASVLGGMRGAIRSIGKDSQDLTRASEGMLAASQQMSANAEETSIQANVVSAASEQVSKSVQTVSVATQEMAASIREVARQATEAARVATSGVRVASATNQTVAKLGESSLEIGKVIKVITSIAEQTNLLALNATIEAARVGEAGKGFAVVANEVKELARETARATEEISRKIEAIQGDSRGVVAAITEIGGIIHQINEIQATIASAVEEQTVTTREIGRNVGEAAAGAAEIARNIMGVAEAARNTSEGAHHTEQAAGELSRMAANLRELVGQFRYE